MFRLRIGIVHLILTASAIAYASNEGAPTSPDCVVETVSAALSRSSQAQTFKYAVVEKAPSPDLKDVVMISTNGIERARDHIDQIVPPLDPGIRAFLDSDGPLGYGGVISPYSSLQKLGPVGVTPWNPSYWISQSWRNLSKKLTKNQGPLNANTGVLSSSSVMGEKTYEKNFSLMPYGEALQEGGLLMILGPRGVYNPKGPVGALSPIGATGYKRDPKTGAFVSGHKILRQVKLAIDGKPEALVDLDEFYSQSYAKRLSRLHELDSSFSVDAKAQVGNPQEYNVRVKANTWVNFLVIPETTNEGFALRILSKDGHPIAVSDSRDLMNFVSARFPNDTMVRVQIENMGSSPYAVGPFFAPDMFKTSGFRLHVTDVPVDPAMNQFDGPHLNILK